MQMAMMMMADAKQRLEETAGTWAAVASLSLNRTAHLLLP
jgi:hypothetical protein